MTRTISRKFLVSLAIALTMSFMVPVGHASAAPATSSPPSKRERIKILTAVLHKMQKDFSKLQVNVPGPDR